MRSFMNYILLLLTVTIFSCKNSDSPKEVATEFITSIHTLEFDNAAALATVDTKVALEQNKQALEQQLSIETEKANRKATTAETLYDLPSLQAEVGKEEATVYNNIVKLHLKKVDGAWKVAEGPETLADVVFRSQNLDAIKTSWKVLQDEYNGRAKVLENYINYKKSLGDATIETTAIESALKHTREIKEPAPANILQYVQKQNALTALLDKGMQPSFTASSDLSVNYIIELNNYKMRITDAINKYNEAVKKTASREYKEIR